MLIYIIGFYLLPLFLLTAQDIALTGLINDSRQMLMDLGNDDSMAATLYGLMASSGIGLIGTIFIKQQKMLALSPLSAVKYILLLAKPQIKNPIKTSIRVILCCLQRTKKVTRT